MRNTDGCHAVSSYAHIRFRSSLREAGVRRRSDPRACDERPRRVPGARFPL